MEHSENAFKFYDAWPRAFYVLLDGLNTFKA